MLGIGGFTPLEGFMTHADWQGVCDGMKTASGLFWPIPITLSADEAFADAIARPGSDIALVDPDDGAVARDDAVDREVRDRQGARVRDACSARPTPRTPASSW